MTDAVTEHSQRIEARELCAATLKTLASDVKAKAAVIGEGKPDTELRFWRSRVDGLAAELDRLADVIWYGGIAHYAKQIAPLISELQRVGMSLLDDSLARKVEQAFAKAAAAGWPERRR